MSKIEFKKFLNLLAFIAVIAVAVALLIGRFVSGDITAALNLVAQCIAYLVTAIYALYYVLAQRNTVITIIYFVAIIAIIVLLVI